MQQTNRPKEAAPKIIGAGAFIDPVLDFPVPVAAAGPEARVACVAPPNPAPDPSVVAAAVAAGRPPQYRTRYSDSAATSLEYRPGQFWIPQLNDNMAGQQLNHLSRARGCRARNGSSYLYAREFIEQPHAGAVYAMLVNSVGSDSQLQLLMPRLFTASAEQALYALFHQAH